MTTKKGIFLFLLFLLPFLFASKLPKRPYFLPPKSEHSYSRSLSLSPLLSSSSSSYFDPHNHYSGILPWDAYPNITSYINNDPLSFNQSLNLWYFLNQTFYPTANPLPTFTPTSRIGSGSWATLFLFQNVSEFQENPEILYGVLERLLTTTPYTEFDTAYNFRSAVLDPEDSRSYYLSTLFPDDPDTINSDICTATVSTLTNTGISSSEQSLPFTSHKWTEEKQCTLSCLTSIPNHPHKILLMGLTNRLAYKTSTQYLSFSPTGECEVTEFGNVVNLTVEADALVGSMRTYFSSFFGGENFCWKELMQFEREDIWDVLVGTDHASPEVSCYTKEGMSYLKELSFALLREVKWRDSQGKWGGRPLVNHIHVGEGFSTYYTQQNINLNTTTFESVFGEGLPGYPPLDNYMTNASVARNNARLVVQAIQEIVIENPEIYGSVVFRLAHLTHIDEDTADLMAQICDEYPGLIEADINLDSNLATEAYTISSGFPVNEYLADILAERETNFLVNDLSRVLIPDPTNSTRVGLIFGNFTALKYLLTAGVPVLLPIMLGTDAAGTEHSSIGRQYQLATSLVNYWSETDPSFAEMDIQSDYFEESVKIHLDVMDNTPHNGWWEDWWVEVVLLGVGVGLLLVVLLVVGGVWVVRRRKGSDYEVVEE